MENRELNIITETTGNRVEVYKDYAERIKDICNHENSDKEEVK